MPGPDPLHRIVLTAEEDTALRQLVRAHSTPHTQRTRALIVLAAYAHPDWSNPQIAAHAHCTDRSVRKWRARWATTHTLTDAPRPGAPRRFPP